MAVGNGASLLSYRGESSATPMDIPMNQEPISTLEHDLTGELAIHETFDGMFFVVNHLKWFRFVPKLELAGV